MSGQCPTAVQNPLVDVLWRVGRIDSISGDSLNDQAFFTKPFSQQNLLAFPSI
jgi:hypothetical protein